MHWEQELGFPEVLLPTDKDEEIDLLAIWYYTQQLGGNHQNFVEVNVFCNGNESKKTLIKLLRHKINFSQLPFQKCNFYVNI